MATTKKTTNNSKAAATNNTDDLRHMYAAAALTGLIASSGDSRNLDPITVKAEANAWADIMIDKVTFVAAEEDKGDDKK